MEQLVLGDLKEVVPGRFPEIVGAEVDVTSDGPVQLALHLAGSGKGQSWTLDTGKS